MEHNCESTPRPNNFKEFLKSSQTRKQVIAILLGAGAGFLYYYYIGCASGTCAITSNPIKSTLMGAFMGWFVVSSPCSRGKC